MLRGTCVPLGSVSIPDEANSTLLVHQHFFGIGNTSLNQEVKDGKGIHQRGVQLAYPRSLASPATFYDRYTFRLKDGAAEPASKYSLSNIFAPEGFTFGSNQVAYDTELAWKAIERSGKPEATELLQWKDGRSYRLYKEYTDRFRYYAHERGVNVSLRTLIKF